MRNENPASGSSQSGKGMCLRPIDCSVAVMRRHDRGSSSKRRHLTGGLSTVSEGPRPSRQGNVAAGR